MTSSHLSQSVVHPAATRRCSSPTLSRDLHRNASSEFCSLSFGVFQSFWRTAEGWYFVTSGNQLSLTAGWCLIGSTLTHPTPVILIKRRGENSTVLLNWFYSTQSPQEFDLFNVRHCCATPGQAGGLEVVKKHVVSTAGCHVASSEPVVDVSTGSLSLYCCFLSACRQKEGAGG